jgi:cytochrome c oxidase cbb3-type subunit 3
MAEVQGRHDAIQGAIVHEYDGIEEADNQLPLWWVVFFIGTVAFGLAYWVGYELLHGRPGPRAQYALDAAALREKKAAEAAAMPDVNDDALRMLATDPITVAAGKAAYVQQCVPCHGERGEGKIGPNLTDEHWIHGSAPLSIHKTITEGVPAKGMPPWGQILGPKVARELAAFVLTLKGTHASGGKAQEGRLEP